MSYPQPTKAQLRAMFDSHERWVKENFQLLPKAIRPTCERCGNEIAYTPRRGALARVHPKGWFCYDKNRVKPLI